MLATEGGGDMLILLTGVGGALSARGLDIPVVEERNEQPTFRGAFRDKEAKLI